jgi:ABC-type polysaccharide/polyol phosphate export permease
MKLQVATENIKKYFDFWWAMTEKETKVRYKRAIFGFLWVILNPILQMLIIGLIFSFFIKIKGYVLFLFSGLLPWEFFSLSISKTTPSIVFERALLKKSKFPIEIIPISIISSNFIHVAVSELLFILVLGAFNKILFPQILLLIPALIWLLGLTISISLIASTLNVRFRDMTFFVQTGLNLAFYATPILYSLSLIPKNLFWLFAFNPMSSVFELIHYSISNQFVLPIWILEANLFITIILLLFGITLFRRNYPYFVVWL